MKPLLFIAFLSLFGNKPSEYRIPYRQLTWADFRCPPPGDQPTIAARTFTQLSMQTTEEGGKYHFCVVAYVLADSSFVRLRDDKTLRHEQTHFTITSIEARKCDAALAPLQGGDSTTLVAAAAFYAHYFDEASRRQDQFDLATNHSLDLVEEKTWEDKISRELRSFETLSPKIHGRSR